MKISKFDRKGTLQRRTIHRDEYGYSSETWTTYRTCWCYIKPLMVVNKDATDNASGLQSFNVAINASSDNTYAGDRLVIGDTTYEINAVFENPDDRAHWTLKCTVNQDRT